MATTARALSAGPSIGCATENTRCAPRTLWCVLIDGRHDSAALGKLQNAHGSRRTEAMDAGLYFRCVLAGLL